MSKPAPKTDEHRRRFWENLEGVAQPLFAWVCLRIPAAARRHADPEDVFQEISYRAFVNFASLEEPERFRAWVFGIGRNVVREELRRIATRSHAVGEPSGGRHVESIAEELTSISRRVARREDIRRLLDVVAELAEDERRLVLYRGLEELSYAEIAELIGVSEEAAKKRWLRLRQRLRDAPLLSDAD